MNKTVTRIFSFLMVTAVTAGWVALAQTPSAKEPQSVNANKQGKTAAPQVPSPTKSTANQETKAVEATPVEATPENANASGVSPNAANASQQTTSDTSAPTKSSTTQRKGKRRSKAATSEAATTTTTRTDQPDWSGTYSGVMNCPDAGVTGDTTLTVTGNQFTLANGTSGRIMATTTQGYTAVTMQFGEATPATPGMAQAAATTPKIISLRGRKNGDRLTLTPISGGPQCSFLPSASVARSRRSRGNRRAAQATGENTSSPVSVPAVIEPSAGPMPEPNTPPKARSARSRAAKTNANANANANKSMNTNENTGAGNVNANSNAKPAPTPSPTPGAHEQ